MILLAASLFLTNPAPLEMPRAEGYCVVEDGVRRLEDRFDRLELWMSRAVLGRWVDDDGRVFTLAKLDVRLPDVDARGTVTRTDYSASTVRLDARLKRDVARRQAAIRALVPPDGLAEIPRSPRQLPRGYRAVEYFQHPTNLSSVVCAFWPEKSDTWYLAHWQLAAGDDFYTQIGAFEDRFLVREFPGAIRDLGVRPPRGRHEAPPSERDELRADAHHSVTNYSAWHVTDAPEFTILDNLPRGTPLVESLTNELPSLRARYAAALPTDVDGSNVLCVARIFATRDEYLAAVGPDMAWTAAYWSPERRELVAYLPPGGTDQLLKTIRHEAFHQYLSYATILMTTSPWLNEGYAEYFEEGKDGRWSAEISTTPESLRRFAKMLPAIFFMDYEEFYDGTAEARRLKYALAWSVAYFIEHGAREVRFDPFKNLKRDYFRSLFRTQDPSQATTSAFGSTERMNLFIDEWLKFWKAGGSVSGN